MAISNTENTAEELVLGTPAGESKSWNWHPNIPIRTSPLFEFPPNPVAIVKWYAGAWLPVTEFGVYLLLAMGVVIWENKSYFGKKRMKLEFSAESATWVA